MRTVRWMCLVLQPIVCRPPLCLCLLLLAFSVHAASVDKPGVPPQGIVAPESDQRLYVMLPDLHTDLRGDWEFLLDPQNAGETERWFDAPGPGAWGAIHVPGSWQAQGWGLDYHGVAWYRRTQSIPPAWNGRRVWIRFGAAATHATLWVNGQPCGEHTGDWTPFEFDVTAAVKCGAPNTLVVRCEELPNHLGAGFPRKLGEGAGHDGHFGGLWQEASLYTSGERHVGDLAAFPNLAEGNVCLKSTLSGQDGASARAVFTVFDATNQSVAETDVALAPDQTSVEATLALPAPAPWSPESPVLYRARVAVLHGDTPSDARNVRFGMRDVVRDGTRLLLNGRPLMVRGVLHWGYYPNLFTMDPSESRIRQEFKDLREAGFNLVKVCMFFFPERFYEIADETGMLIWQEYPVWQTFPAADAPGPFDDFVKAYDEWFRFDRSHPSIILRDLACEAANPHPALMKQIYDRAKACTGGALIEDNSAYLNQVSTDWYDVHAYRDLDDYVRYADELAAELRQKTEAKPFIAGEDFDFDTYRDVAAMRRRFAVQDRLPWWMENACFHAQESFDRDLGPAMPTELARRQRRHVLAARKGCFEAFRKQPEFSGYVMTSIRDNPLTRPGFYDDFLRPKWHPNEWKMFNADRVILVQSPRESMCFRDDETPSLELRCSNYGAALEGAPMRWCLSDGHAMLVQGDGPVTAAPGQTVPVATCTLRFAKAATPVVYRLMAEITVEQEPIRNQWSVWVFPSAPRAPGNVNVCVRDAAPADPALDGFRTIPVVWAADPGEWRHASTHEPVDWTTPENVLLSAHFDAPVEAALKQGARVLYVAADDDTGMPRHETPFWRETAIWLPNAHPALGEFPQDGYADRQFLDMTQRKPFALGSTRSAVKPLVWGVNARFAETTVSDYVFEARYGQGRLLASCLRTGGAENIAGRYLLQSLLRYAASPAFNPVAPPEKASAEQNNQP